jgi:hypothetical protein
LEVDCVRSQPSGTPRIRVPVRLVQGQWCRSRRAAAGSEDVADWWTPGVDLPSALGLTGSRR